MQRAAACCGPFALRDCPQALPERTDPGGDAVRGPVLKSWRNADYFFLAAFFLAGFFAAFLAGFFAAFLAGFLAAFLAAMFVLS